MLTWLWAMAAADPRSRDSEIKDAVADPATANRSTDVIQKHAVVHDVQ